MTYLIVLSSSFQEEFILPVTFDRINLPIVRTNVIFANDPDPFNTLNKFKLLKQNSNSPKKKFYLKNKTPVFS